MNTANTAGFTGAYAREHDERGGLLVFSGNANRPLATEVCRVLNVPPMVSAARTARPTARPTRAARRMPRLDNQLEPMITQP